MLQRAVDEVMVRFSNVERVKRVAVLGDEWLPDGDELTPTSKLKRRSILAKYADADRGHLRLTGPAVPRPGTTSGGRRSDRR